MNLLYSTKFRPQLSSELVSESYQLSAFTTFRQDPEISSEGQYVYFLPTQCPEKYNYILTNKNRDDKIRTCDPRDPNTVRYQAALHPDIFYLRHVAPLRCFLSENLPIRVTFPRQSQAALHPEVLCIGFAPLRCYLSFRRDI